MPTDWAAAALANAGLLQPLDMERLPELALRHAAARSCTAPYDVGVRRRRSTPRSTCSAPKASPCALDKVDTTRRSWEMLFDPAFAGQITMLDGSREVLAPALFLLGATPTRPTATSIERATDMLIEQRRLVTRLRRQDRRGVASSTASRSCTAGTATSRRRSRRGDAASATCCRRRVIASGSTRPCIPAERARPRRRAPLSRLPAAARGRGGQRRLRRLPAGRARRRAADEEPRAAVDAADRRADRGRHLPARPRRASTASTRRPTPASVPRRVGARSSLPSASPTSAGRRPRPASCRRRSRRAGGSPSRARPWRGWRARRPAPWAAP